MPVFAQKPKSDPFTKNANYLNQKVINPAIRIEESKWG